MDIGINRRLEVLIDRLNLNPNSFAEAIGVAPPAVYNIVKGRKTKPSYDFLLKLKQRYQQTDMNWLIADVGTPFLSDAVAEPEVHNEPLDAIDVIEIPKWMTKQGVLLGIQIKGLSMHPVIPDGSIVIIRKIDSQDWGRFTNRNIHLVYSDSYGCQVKYLRRSERNPNFLLLDSENYDENPSIGLSISEVFQIWEVEMSLNFKFISQRRKIVERVDSLEAAYAELAFEVEKLKEH